MPFYSFLAYGVIIRYRYTSKVCSGDLIENDKNHSIGEGPYLWNSGMFSKVIVPCVFFVEVLRYLVN